MPLVGFILALIRAPVRMLPETFACLLPTLELSFVNRSLGTSEPPDTNSLKPNTEMSQGKGTSAVTRASPSSNWPSKLLPSCQRLIPSPVISPSTNWPSYSEPQSCKDKRPGHAGRSHRQDAGLELSHVRHTKDAMAMLLPAIPLALVLKHTAWPRPRNWVCGREKKDSTERQTSPGYS